MRIGKLRNKILIFSFLFFSISGIIFLSMIFGGSRMTIPDFTSVKNHYRPSDVWIVDHQLRPMASLRQNPQHRSLDWVEWSQVSETFKQLIIQVEDQRFYHHFGVDFLALTHATWTGLINQKFKRGGSTLTMQLYRLLQRTSESAKTNYLRKIFQILGAIKLELTWSKDEILEAYINLLPLRGELVGLRAASMGFFDKHPEGLLTTESALLIALIRSPNAEIALVIKRACEILKSVDCEPLHTLAETTIGKSYHLPRHRDLIPILSDHVKQSTSTPSLIQTTLDIRTQTMAMSLLREQLRILKPHNVNDGAVLVLETATGKVLAYVGNGAEGFTSAAQVDGVQSKRQAGSTIKPFVYATALEKRLLTPSALLNDSPADITVAPGKVYHPRNYDHTFRGLVSASEALGSSLNVPAVKALQLMGESHVLQFLREFGLNDLFADDYYGPSLALGAVDVSLWEMTQGYRQLATNKLVLSDQTRDDLFNMLAAPEYRRFTFGMNSLLSLPFPAAVKTGTSKDMRDNWCIGWTTDYTIGVWVGNFNGEPMWNVSGMSGAAPIWRHLMLSLSQQLIKNPHHLNQLTHYYSPAPKLPVQMLTRIRYPAPEMLVGIDPDIPKAIQKLPIEIENPLPGHSLYLNQTKLSLAKSTVLWSLEKGSFLLELKNSSDSTIDQVEFEVR
jgi:penicillin-binding protein 1C